jgi:NAD(P) transhydrogenase
LGLDEVTSATYLVSSALCIAAIACLSQQSSARTGNALGLIGVSSGVVATLGGLNTDPGTYAQVVGSLAAGGLVGNQIASRINITDLPQMVAAYHSLVGLAAAITSIATIMMMSDGTHDMDGVHMVTAFLGDIIGAITLTGSVSSADWLLRSAGSGYDGSIAGTGLDSASTCASSVGLSTVGWRPACGLCVC